MQRNKTWFSTKKEGNVKNIAKLSTELAENCRIMDFENYAHRLYHSQDKTGVPNWNAPLNLKA